MFSLAQIAPPRPHLAILAVCLVSTLSSCKKASDHNRFSDEGIKGTIYVRQAQGVGYAALDGQVLELTCDLVRINVTNAATNQAQRLMFTRDDVQEILLTDPGNANQELARLYADGEKTASRCWNRPKSPWVAGVQGVPFIGRGLSFLDSLPPGFGIFLAIMILATYGLYGGFKVYGVLKRPADTTALSRTKLEREIDKLECEIVALRHQLGLTAAPLPAPPSTAAPSALGVRVPTDQAAIRMQDFLWHTLLRVPRKTEIEERRARLQKQWLERGKMNDRALRITYYARLTLNVILFTLAVIFCLSLLSDTIFLLLNPIFVPDMTSGERLWTSFSCFVFAVGFASLSLKLRVRRQILREAYRNVQTELTKQSPVPV